MATGRAVRPGRRGGPRCELRTAPAFRGFRSSDGAEGQRLDGAEATDGDTGCASAERRVRRSARTAKYPATIQPATTTA